jgi:hypothetical protein
MTKFETIYKILFVASAAGVGCYPLYIYWKIYGVYKRAGEWAKKIGFFWFSFYAQTPHFGRGATMLEALPQKLQAQVAIIRSNATRAFAAILLWILFLILLGTFVKRFKG